MKSRVVSTILTCLNLLLVEGFDADYTRRLLNGVNQFGEDWQWIVRVFDMMDDGVLLVYSGSIITERWILTSARGARDPVCEFTEIFPSTWKAGDKTTIGAELCIHHPLHRLNNYFFYNIGLIQANQDLVGPNFATINLPPEGMHNCPGDTAQILGWGRDKNGVEPETLQAVVADIESWKQCNEKFRQSYDMNDYHGKNIVPSVVIPKTGFCTNGSRYSGTGTCIGDGGGPVVVNDILTGVVSGGLDNDIGQCLLLSIHINIADYLPWIYSVIEPQKDTSAIIVGSE